jgi:hypothetical protein
MTPDPRTGIIGDGDPVDFVDVGPLLVRDAEEKLAEEENKSDDDEDDDDVVVRTGDIRAAVVLGALALVAGHAIHVERSWFTISNASAWLKPLERMKRKLGCFEICFFQFNVFRRYAADGNETDWKIIVAGVDELKRLASIDANLGCDPATPASVARVPTDIYDVPVDILNQVHLFFRDYKTADGGAVTLDSP